MLFVFLLIIPYSGQEGLHRKTVELMRPLVEKEAHLMCVAAPIN